MKHFWLWLVVPVVAQAQFVAVEQGDKDKGFQRTEIHVDTMDRTVVPLTVESTTRKLSDTKSQTESVTQTRLADGSYFTSQRERVVTEKVSPTETRTVTQIQETDRQGQSRTAREVTETVTRTGAGEQRSRAEYARNSSGELVLNRRVAETVTKNPDGSSTAQRVEQELDVNGKMVPKREVQEQAVFRGPNERVISSNIRTYDHLTGSLNETGREVTTVRTSGGTTQSERIIQERIGPTWAVKGKVETKETKSPTGSIERETIQYGRPLFTGERYSSEEPLQPRQKIVERAVTGPDGKTRVQRDVYQIGRAHV